MKPRELFREHEIASLFALRMGLSAVVAYLAAVLIHTPETTWPVMSAIIVARASGQSAGGSAFDRLAGTLAGAAAGLLGGFLAHIGVPGFVVLALVITPLAFLSSDYGAFRAAPVAALIVMSAAETHGSGVAPAILRVGDVGIGALAAIIVSRFVMPGLPLRALKHAVAQLTEPLFKLFALSWRSDVEARDKFAKLSLRIRRELREAAIIARGIKQKRNGETESPENRLVTVAGRVHGSIAFIARALDNAPELREMAMPFIGAVRGRLDAIREILEGRASTPSELDTSLNELEARIESFAKARHLDALPFLLQALKGDLDELADAALKL